jgi:hypothetical protein
MGDSLELSVVDRRKIQEWIAAHGTPQQVALRCRIVLGASEGEADSGIALRICTTGARAGKLLSKNRTLLESSHLY